MLKKPLSESGAQAVELGTGGFPSKAHANPDELLNDDSKIRELRDLLEKYNLHKERLQIASIKILKRPSD